MLKGCSADWMGRQKSEERGEREREGKFFSPRAAGGERRKPWVAGREREREGE